MVKSGGSYNVQRPGRNDPSIRQHRVPLAHFHVHRHGRVQAERLVQHPVQVGHEGRARVAEGGVGVVGKFLVNLGLELGLA